MASLWQKRGGTWCVTYRDRGKQRVRSLRTKDRREALKLKRAIETSLDDNGSVVLEVCDRPKQETKNPTMDDFWESFMRWAHCNRAARTVEEYGNWFRQLREFTGAERLGDVTNKDIEDFKIALTKQGKRTPKGVGLERTSINNALKTIATIWNQAIRLKLYTGENPTVGAERFKLPKNLDRDFLQKEQIDAMLKAAIKYAEQKYVRRLDSRNVYLAIALMALAGLRKREVCYARWEWVNFENKIITVSNEDDFTTKNRKPRIISLNARLIDILKSHRADTGYILQDARANNGKTEYRADFKKSFRKVCDLARVDTTPHQLRHSFASRHAVAGTSLHVIAGWLGHSTTWVTQRYAHFQKTFNAAADNI